MAFFVRMVKSFAQLGTRMPKLRSLDLFSGVGGITRALHGFAEPIAYCDVDPLSRRALQDLIGRGELPAAPVSSDVNDLDAAWLRKHAGTGKPLQLIVGGFPCVGFSPFGLRKGFGNEESNLFYQILRIADQTRCPALFLENVPPILNMGMREVVYQLAHKRGYEVRWCLASARMMGAPHQRNRWYCLAVKPGFSCALRSAVKYRAFSWSKSSMPPRAVEEQTSGTIASQALMGNSVVPDAVRYAFLYLASRFTHVPVRSLSTKSGWHVEPAPRPSSAAVHLARAGEPPKLKRWPRCCIYTPAGEMVPHPSLPPYRPGLQLKLVFDSHLYKAPQGYSELKIYPILRRPVVAKSWATPRHGVTGASNALTQRTVRDLPSQVRFERSTPNRLRPGAVNPVFVEWLMGYPAGWTRGGGDRSIETRGL